jgi:hypothetical protein
MQYRHGEVVDLLPVFWRRCVCHAPTSQKLDAKNHDAIYNLKQLQVR